MSNDESGAESNDSRAAEEQDDEDAAVADMYDREAASTGENEAAGSAGGDGSPGDGSPEEDGEGSGLGETGAPPGSGMGGGEDAADPMAGGPPGGLEGPLAADEEPETATGTFYVKHVEDVAVTLHEVDTGQIITLVENPGFERHEIIEAVLVAQPPMQVSYLIEELESRRTIPVERSEEAPTSRILETGKQMEDGQAIAVEREGEGEIHILSVVPTRTDETAEELLDDEMTYKNAARYGVGRVEIRTDGEHGIVSIRYLP